MAPRNNDRLDGVIRGPARLRAARRLIVGGVVVGVAVLLASVPGAAAGVLGIRGVPGPRASGHPPAPPPVDPDLKAPGGAVGSGQYESDPFLFLSHGRYFLYTSDIPGHPTVNVPVASATTFGTWTPVMDALPTLPAWAAPGYTWAPDIHQFGSAYVLYFTALVAWSSPATECIGAATGSSPDGPFTPLVTPLICQTGLGGSIDPRVFTDEGRNWMVWKSDQNIGGSAAPTSLWSQPLAPDGLRLTGSPADLMQPDEAWQGTIVEAPDMVDVDGVYWVFYAGNWFNQAAYAIGAARCAGPAGPCADSSPWPLLATNDQGSGPGEASVYQDAAGDVWLLYSPWHSAAPHPDVFPRPVYITRLGFRPSGPYLASGGWPPDVGMTITPSPWSAP